MNHPSQVTSSDRRHVTLPPWLPGHRLGDMRKHANAAPRLLAFGIAPVASPVAARPIVTLATRELYRVHVEPTPGTRAMPAAIRKDRS